MNVGCGKSGDRVITLMASQMVMWDYESFSLQPSIYLMTNIFLAVIFKLGGSKVAKLF